MIAVQVLDENNNMKTKSNNDGVDLDVAVEVSLPQPCQLIKENPKRLLLTCLRVDKKSIIFWTARVPCMFREMLTKSCATDSQMRFLCSSVEYSKSFWQR